MDRTISQAPETDPISEPVKMDIDRIQPYERNPRHGANPEYDRIKDSIRHNGLDQPLVITRRPDCSDYVVHSGGNTRLLILKALFAETGEARFGVIPCVIKPWQGESSVVLAHLRENDLRGNLNFIDKARAVDDARQLLTAELEVRSLTQRQFEQHLCEAGYRLNRSGLSLMSYAVHVLFPLIPVALDSGLGRDPVRGIRALDRAGRLVWRRYCTGGEPVFEQVFATLCRRYDGIEWDNAILHGALETEIADSSELNLQTVRVAFDAALNNQEIVIPDFVPIKPPPPRLTAVPARADPPEDEQSSQAHDVGHQSDDDLTVGKVAPVSTPDDPSDPKISSVQFSTAQRDEVPDDLKSLRARASALAAGIAQRNGIGELVEPAPDNGLGYILRDVPDGALADQLDDEGLAQVSLLWWQLAACAEMTSAPLDSVVSILPRDSILRRALEEDNADLLFSNVWTLDPGHTGYRLWRIMHDRDWSDLLSLMENYRRLRHCATRTGETLWS